MKKYILAAAAVFALACAAQFLTVSAAPYPAALGGTGSSQIPASGTIPIGNGAGSYTPAKLTPGADVQITNGSGTVTIAVTGTATGTVYLLSGGHGISLSPATITSSGTIAVVTSTLISDVIASGNLLPSSTVYVASVNGSSGAVTLGIPATTTVNAAQASVFRIIGDGTTVTSTVVGTTTTFSIISTGNWAGTWQGNSSSSFYAASNPSNFISANQSITLRVSGDATGTASGATTITDALTVTGLQGKALPALATGTLQYTGGAWSFNGNTYLLSGINVTTTAPLGGGGSLTAAGLTLTCATCLTANQTITLTGAVTGSGATSIATAYTTSTLFGFFSASGPIAYSSATGQFSWTNSNGYVSSISVNGNPGTSFQILAGAGVTSTVNGTSTALTLNLSGTCSGGQFVQSVTATGTITCATPSGGASSTNVYGAGGVTVLQVGTNATATINEAYQNAWTSLQSFLGGISVSGAATFASTTTGFAFLSPTGTLSSVPSSTFLAGYVTSSGITAIDGLTNATETFNASSGLTVVTSSPNVHTYALNIGGSCSVGMAVTSVSATGTLACSAFATSTAGLSSYNVSSANSSITVTTTTTSAVLNFASSSYVTTSTASSTYYPLSNPAAYTSSTSNVSTSTANTWSANQQLSGGLTNASGTKIGAAYSELVSPVAGEGSFTSIQPAINADCALASPGTVFVKAGTYALGATGLTVSSTCTGFGLLGESESSTRITYTGTGSALTVGNASGSILYANVGNFTITGNGSGIAFHSVEAQTFNFHDIYLTGFTTQATSTALQGTGMDIDGNGVLTADGFVSNVHADHNDIDLLVTGVANGIYFNGLDLYGQNGPSSTLILMQNGVGNTFNITNLSSATNGMVVNTAGNIIHIGYGELLTNELTFGSGATDNFAVEQAFSNVTTTVKDNSSPAGTNDVFVMNGNTYLASTTVTTGGLTVANGQANFYDSGNGGINVYRGSTANYGTNCLGTGTTAWWCLQLNPNGTNNLTLADSQDGGAALTANINGSTTIGNSGTGNSLILPQKTINLPSSTAASELLSTDPNSNVTSTAVGSYLSLSGGTLSASTTLASSSVTFVFDNATTTKPYSFEDVASQSKKTIAGVDCWEYANATATVELYYNAANASSGIQQVVLPSLACGVNGTSTTSFTTSTIPAGAYLFAIVSSTAGTPQQTTLNVYAQKL